MRNIPLDVEEHKKIWRYEWSSQLYTQTDQLQAGFMSHITYGWRAWNLNQPIRIQQAEKIYCQIKSEILKLTIRRSQRNFSIAFILC